MATRYLCIFATLCAAVNSAPPTPSRLYQRTPAHLQAYPLDYFMENGEVQYYNQQLQKQDNNEGGAPARLETLEPDSEVELIPGAQQPQQPPQQNPVAPGGNGIIPGRVFIVHMPVPGYRPGTIGGYQPVYVVAAAPQGNTAYAPNGYQNAVLVNPSGQVISPISPFFGYPGVQQPIGPANNGYLVGPPLAYNREYEQLYQGPGVPAYTYGPIPGRQGQQASGTEGPRGAVHLSQLVNLHQQQQQLNAPRASAEASSNSEPKRVGAADSDEAKEAQELVQESRRNRPAPALMRNKA